MINKKNAKERLFYLRCKYGKTQEQVSTASGVSRVTINRIETGKGESETLRAETFYKLNQYFESLGERENN